MVIILVQKIRSFCNPPFLPCGCEHSLADAGSGQRSIQCLHKLILQKVELGTTIGHSCLHVVRTFLYEASFTKLKMGNRNFDFPPFLLLPVFLLHPPPAHTDLQIEEGKTGFWGCLALVYSLEIAVWVVERASQDLVSL